VRTRCRKIDRARLIPVDAIRADSIVKRKVVTWAKEVQGINADYVVTDTPTIGRSAPQAPSRIWFSSHVHPREFEERQPVGAPIEIDVAFGRSSHLKSLSRNDIPAHEKEALDGKKRCVI
jgi:hypothetical protein